MRRAARESSSSGGLKGGGLRLGETMRDRTQEFREDDGSSDDEEAERVVLVVKPGSAKSKDEGEPPDEFFQTARGIREALKTLEGKVKDLEKHQTTILATPLPEDSKPGGRGGGQESFQH
ncbi:hypothetical protein KIL84_007658 [Mauremys mutica]|uniref:Uncharacterized protein n=1 Tax=Mauremys mutica TaxID=74926 RepID=A0A9D3X3T2_9SAUR|nr:hypothetical protein KIL84_007658 [Mauremys mutica]